MDHSPEGDSSWAAYTYVKLYPKSSIKTLLERLNQEVDLVYPGYTEDVLSKEILSVPLLDIHFTEGTLYELKSVANKAYLSTFGIVAFVLLLIIWTNYTNLSIAMYADRQKELGIRKVLGAQPMDVTLQLLVEAVLLALLCFPFCLLIVWAAYPHFGELMGISFGAKEGLPASVLLLLFVLLLFTGLLSGSYPAVAYGKRSISRLFGQGSTPFSFHRHLNTGIYCWSSNFLW